MITRRNFFGLSLATAIATLVGSRLAPGATKPYHIGGPVQPLTPQEKFQGAMLAQIHPGHSHGVYWPSHSHQINDPGHEFHSVSASKRPSILDFEPLDLGTYRRG
jgi:hypothetical protein